jgi:membrane protease subunit HflK
MNLKANLPFSRLHAAWSRMFNLNDPRWGRGDSDGEGKSSGGNTPDPDKAAPPASAPRPQQDAGRPASKPGNTQGPPDLDELWRDFNQKLSGLFGGNGGGRRPGNEGGAPRFNPNPKSAGIGLGLVGAVALVFWGSTGFFIVQEGQQGVITQFGKYNSTVGAGFNWRLPYPIQRHELVFATQIRSVDVGRDSIVRATGLRESAMLTEDENIVEVKFAVQYRLNDARAYLFESRDPDAAVIKAAETAVREVVGKMKMDSALAEERDQIAPRVRNLMQAILDRYKVGIDVVAINMQQGGVRPPEQVQAAFDDVLKAGQERERVKNEAQAYANDVVPRAQGAASRLREEAEGYRSRIVAQAKGDTERFKSVLNEYQKAPQVTRERMYVDAMQEVYTNATKVLIDVKQSGNLLYLPLDKLMKVGGDTAAPHSTVTTPPTVPSAAPKAAANDKKSRTPDAERSRQRDVR